MAGPTTNPTPYAAPRSPKTRMRSSGPTMSVADAWATATLPPDAPSRTRATMSSHNEPATPVRRLAAAVPASDTMSRGLRPTRSDSRPSNGALTNCAAENAAEEEPDRRGAGAEAPRVQRQEGDDDAEAEKVDGHRGPQHPEPRRKPATRRRADRGARRAATPGRPTWVTAEGSARATSSRGAAMAAGAGPR